MPGCSSGSLLLVNAGVDSMGGVIDGGIEISSTPSLQQSSDLQKTQAELRDTFTAAEKYRQELEFLQKGGDPLDLKIGNEASVSLQSTSLTDQHPEQFVTSEVKGSFAITASPHGDSVESSGRLGAPSVGEPNSADNLMLFDGDNKFREVEKRSLGDSVALELPKKSYKRRIRSRPNREGARSSSTDAGQRSGQPKPKSPNPSLGIKNLGSKDVKLNGQTQKSTLSGTFVDTRENLSDQPLTSDTHDPPSVVDTQTADVFEKIEERKTTLTNQIDQSLDANKKSEVANSLKNVSSNGTMELNLASKEEKGNDVTTVKEDTLKKEEHLKGSESKGNDLEVEKKVLGSDSVKCSVNDAEENDCSKKNLEVATKEHEDKILEEARIIEEKRKKIAGLSVGILSSENNCHKSHWHFVLEEMSWLANDFAQERLWKVTAAAQISQRAAYSSRVRFQQQRSTWKQKEVAHALAEAVMEFWHEVQVKCGRLELEGDKKDSKIGLHQYVMRFMEFNKSHGRYNSAQAPLTPDRISDLGSIDISWEDNLTEENLFYTVPPGAIEAYRKSIESHLLQCERTGSSIMQEEVDANGYDAVADNTLEEDEGETSTYYLPGAFEGSRASKNAQKNKRKHFKSYTARSSYEMSTDFSFPQSFERNNNNNNIANQPSVLSGKRPATSINVSIPTKRVRTASRPRFSGTSGYIQAQYNRADASSGDTNSFQDEQSSFLHGGSQIPNNNMEAESVGDYEKQLQFDMTEVSNRPKKKKKTKHPGSAFDHRWQLDSNFQNEQIDHSKRRLDTRQFDSNGNSVASQMSNMSNPNKFMKLLVRDRGRKAKSLHKTPVGPQDSGSPWSLFEDQALVVLVHDMGANWELISDAINSTLQFKCISRNSKECKERHKELMDRNTGDGADSADDSGSSQPYPSTLPGIPEGSARQLFQRLQGPMEEDTLKSHFEKIIMISQKLHYRKGHKDNQDPKQLQQPHSSHALALSQVSPNNLNGGPVLTPLDLCDSISPSPEFLPVNYQAPHSGGLPLQNHASSSANSLPSSSNLVHGSHLSSTSSAPLSPSVREAKYGITRPATGTGSLSIEEQHRMQQYNQILSARNMQPNVRMGGRNMGMTMARPVGPGQGNSNSNSVRPGGMASFANQPRPMSPRMPNANSNSAYSMRMMKERQLQQQRLLQQQFASSSNPMLPPGQQLPVSSPQPQPSSPSVSLPMSMSQHPQKLPVPPPPHGLVRNPQSGGSLTVKRPPHQLQAPPGRQHPQSQQQLQQPVAKVTKGGGRGMINQNNNVPINGFAGGQSSGLNPGIPVASKQSMQMSMPPHSSLNPKRFPGQPQGGGGSSSSKPQPHPKLMNQSHVPSASKIVLSRKPTTSADLPAVRASNDASNSETQNRKTSNDSSSGAVLENVGKVSTPPQSNSEHPEPPANHGGSSGGGGGGGVQWQQPSS